MMMNSEPGPATLMDETRRVSTNISRRPDGTVGRRPAIAFTTAARSAPRRRNGLAGPARLSRHKDGPIVMASEGRAENPRGRHVTNAAEAGKMLLVDLEQGRLFPYDGIKASWPRAIPIASGSPHSDRAGRTAGTPPPRHALQSPLSSAQAFGYSQETSAS